LVSPQKEATFITIKAFLFLKVEKSISFPSIFLAYKSKNDLGRLLKLKAPPEPTTLLVYMKLPLNYDSNLGIL